MLGGNAPLHVTPYGRAWAVRSADDGAPISVHMARDAAVGCARRLADELSTLVVVFDEHWEVTGGGDKNASGPIHEYRG